ncbi:hypothetical protein [Photobacterium leiognathi]|uniref:hypothetical protein n=1 Tax=Photobacterium leiognathi TaxID=553611 RepID=UPI002738D0EA|nr:hypothetical protein [Photobacterium leiognathi]
MAAEKLTRGRLIQILVLMTVLVSAFIWRTVTYNSPEQEVKVEDNAKTCSLDTQNCQYSLSNKTVELSLLTKELSAQAPIKLQVSNIDVKPVGVVSGVSMNMGTVPVVFTKQGDNTWIGEFTVPACTHNEMTWGADIKINDQPIKAQFVVKK